MTTKKEVSEEEPLVVSPTMNVVGERPSRTTRKSKLRATRNSVRRPRDYSQESFVRTIGLMMFAAIVAVQLMPRDGSYPYLEQALLAVTENGSPASKTDDFQLAYQQSYGFFDDITEADWKRYQQRARDHQNHADPNRPNGRWPRTQPALFYMNNYDPFFTCAHVRRLGGQGDGPKWTCDPHRLARVSQERKQKAEQQQQQQQVASKSNATKVQSNCLIYSFGCAGKYQWEEGLAQALMGPDGKQRDCEIHVFDFSGDFTREGHADTYNIHFHRWGLKSTYDDSMLRAFPKQNNPQFLSRMLTLDQVIATLGHEGHVIDILKVDCEFCEWFSYKDWLAPHVDIRQLLIETHNLPKPDENPQSNQGGHWFPMSTQIKPNDFFDDIEKAGYAMYSKEPNIHPQAGGNGVEFAYIKLHPDFFKPDNSTSSK